MPMGTVRPIDNIDPMSLVIQARISYSDDSAQRIAQEIGVALITHDCQLSIATRTSSMLLVAGFGSYFTYCLANRYLGDHWINTVYGSLRLVLNRIFDRHEFDIRSNATCLDKRRIKVSALASTPDEYSSSFLVFADDEESLSDDGSVEMPPTRETTLQYSSLQNSPYLRHRMALREKYKQRGQQANAVTELLAKADSSSKTDDINEEHGSEILSASLNLQWEEPSWDDEIGLGSVTSASRQRRPLLPQDAAMTSASPAPSEISCLISVRSLDKIAGSQQTEKHQYDAFEENVMQVLEEAEEINNDLAQLMQRSCDMAHRREFYRSVVVAPSSIGSEKSKLSRLSTHSNSPSVRFLRNRGVNHRTDECGLLALSQKSRLDLDASYHTEISTDLSIPPEDARPRKARMLDSAISTEASCSSDVDGDRKVTGIVRRSDLFHPQCTIWEPAGGTASSVSHQSKNQSSNMDAFSMASMEWDDELESKKRDNPIHNQVKRTNCQRDHTTIDSMTRSLELSRIVSRDLMVYAREKYINKPNTIKVLQALYCKRQYRRCLHIPDCDGSSNCDYGFNNTLNGVIHATLMHRTPIIQCSNWSTINDSVKYIIKRCPFINHWQFSGEMTNYYRRNCANNNVDSGSVHNIILAAMRHLFIVQENAQKSNAYMMTKDDNMHVLNCAVRILMLLRAIEVYDTTINQQEETVKHFYKQLFNRSTLPGIMKQLNMIDNSDNQLPADAVIDADDAELLTALLADTAHIRLELYRPDSNQPNLVAVFPDRHCDTRNNATAIAMLQSNDRRITPLLYTEATTLDRLQ